MTKLGQLRKLHEEMSDLVHSQKPSELRDVFEGYRQRIFKIYMEEHGKEYKKYEMARAEMILKNTNE